MFFRVKKDLRWDGRDYQLGDIVDIQEGNPRIGGLMMAGIIFYDACAPNPDEPEKQGIPVEKIKRRVRRKSEE